MKRLRDLIQRWLGDPRVRASLAGATGAATFLIGVTAGAVSDSGGGTPHLNLWEWDSHAPPVGWGVINLTLFIIVVSFLAGPAVKRMFVRRHEEVKALLDSSQAAFAAAKAELDDYKQRLATVEEAVTALTEGARRDGTEERDRIIAAAKDYAARLSKDTDAVLEQEVALARRRLRQDVVGEVLRDAEILLQQTLNPEDQVRLLDQAIAELGDVKDTPQLRRAV